MNIPQLRLPRMVHWIVLALLLLAAISLLSPQQLPVILYKCAQVSIFTVLGYWIDRSLFPYARPHTLMETYAKPIQGDRGFTGAFSSETAYSASMIRRALIIFAVVLAGSIGL